MKKFIESNGYVLLSWGVTALIVAGLLGFAFWRLQARPAVVVPENETESEPVGSGGPVVSENLAPNFIWDYAIGRKLTLKTIIPERPRYDVLKHTVQRGDSLYRISKEFNIKPETVLWANFDVLEDDPHSLKPGQELNLPPIDGLLYTWEDGDTIEGIAAEYEAQAEDIISWPGNNLDLADPKPAIGQLIMIPGGWRESKAPTVDAGGAAAGTCNVTSSGFGWPAGDTYLSGNDYFPGHYGIDISAVEGAPIYAAASGVVTKALSGWNSGYGNYIVIDHCNGYSTLYAHLSAINVSSGMVVGRGTVIGASGNTGNSFGAHLHFEVRLNGSFVNPWLVFQ